MCSVKNRLAVSTALSVCLLAALAVPVWADSPADMSEDTSGAFELGTIVITGQRQVSPGDRLSRQDIERHDRADLGEALNLLPGVSLSHNSRNESLIYVRGFDPRQVPVFIDGIPVYVPYDGYIDFARFSTDDLAAIQVAKGFSSVAYGANALGGAINLVTRQPSESLEGNLRLGSGSGDQRRASLNIGSRQAWGYIQAGLSHNQADGFPLSGDFKPTATEDGGQRNNAYYKDQKLSLKVALTPNDHDEYTLSYVRQDGEKGQPPSTDPAAARYWQWPYWNKESLYFVSRTALSATETLKLRVYEDRFGNEVRSFADDRYTTLKTSGRGSVGTGRSLYDDRTTGASAELESRRIDRHTLRLIVHHKIDNHLETDANAAVGARYKDRFLSVGIEDTFRLSERLRLSLGAARHHLKPVSVFSAGSTYSLPPESKADNVQAGLFFDQTPDARFHVTFAQKTRLPTLKDRYSQRLGSYIENPDLQPEKALNYEIGYQGRPLAAALPHLRLDAALFRSDIHDKIQSAYIGPVGSACSDTTQCQMRNIGKVRLSGIEISARHNLSAWLEIGGSYTGLETKTLSQPHTRLIDIPRHKLTLEAIATPLERLEIVGFVEHDSARWSSETVQIDGFTTLNLKTRYALGKGVALEAGINNLTDETYQLSDGFPSAGRNGFINLRYDF